MEKIAETVNNALSAVNPYVWLIVCVGSVGCGLALAFGNKNEKFDNAKKYLIGGIIAAVLIAGASSLAQMITGWIAF